MEANHWFRLNFHVKYAEDPCTRNITRVYMAMSIELKMSEGKMYNSNNELKKDRQGTILSLTDFLTLVNFWSACSVNNFHLSFYH